MNKELLLLLPPKETVLEKKWIGRFVRKERGISKLWPALKQKTDITELCLKSKQIGNTSMSNVIIPALKSNTLLARLDLSCNAIGDKALVMLSAWLKENTSLQTLNLARNKFTINGLKSLMYALKTGNSALLTLNIGCNEIDAEGAAAIGRMLANNKTLECLNIEASEDRRATKISHSGLVDLFAGLICNSTLKRLGLKNQIDTSKPSAADYKTWKALFCGNRGLREIEYGKRGGSQDETMHLVSISMALRDSGNPYITKMDSYKYDTSNKLYFEASAKYRSEYMPKEEETRDLIVAALKKSSVKIPTGVLEDFVLFHDKIKTRVGSFYFSRK